MSFLASVMPTKEPTLRNFKVAGSGIDFEGGQYRSATPMEAAKKAGSNLFRRMENNTKYKRYRNKRSSIKFILRETTRGSDKKSYYYEVKRTKKQTPVTYKIGDKVITVTWDYMVSSCDAF